MRFRYGICLNERCEKCNSQEVQVMPVHMELVCLECGQPLRECPPPKGGGMLWAYIAIGALLVIGCLAWWLAHSADPGTTEDTKTEVVNENLQKERDSLQYVADSLQQAGKQNQQTKTITENPAATRHNPAPTSPQPAIPVPTTVPTPKAEAKPASAPNSDTKPAPAQTIVSGSKDLGYAIFKGTLRNGQPDDVRGRLTFKSSHVIDSRDPKKRVAEAGDYVIGEFSEGHLVQGIWYGADNQAKGSVLIGK